MARQEGAAAIHFEVRVQHLALLDRWRRQQLNPPSRRRAAIILLEQKLEEFARELPEAAE